MLMSLLPAAANAYDLDLGLDTSDFYIGVGLGSATMEGPRTRTYTRRVNEIIWVNYPQAGQRIKDRVDVSEIHVGYNVNDFISFELGYADYGKSHDKYYAYFSGGCGVVPPCWEPYTVSIPVEIDTYVISLSTLFKYPVHDDFSVYGLISIDRVNAKTSYNNKTSVSDNLGYGAGIRWAFTEKFAAKLQWKKTRAVNTGFTFNNRLNLSDTRLILEMSY